jgi:transcriptional regulator with XRE-family HTH domain
MSDNQGMRQVSVNSIGEYIREQREQAKISLRQLSQAAGVSNPYLSQIERGLRKPSAEILQQIAKGLRISAEALYVHPDRAPEAGADRDLRVVPQGRRRGGGPSGGRGAAGRARTSHSIRIG